MTVAVATPRSTRDQLAVTVLVVLALAVLLKVTPSVAAGAVHANDAARLAISLVCKWVAAAAVVAVVVFGERRSVQHVGIRRCRPRWLLVASACAPLVTVMNVVAARATPHSTETLFSLAHLSILAKVALIITAAITEELVHRGYLMERLLEVARRPAVAVAVSAAMFAASHVPAWGVSFGLVGAVPAGVVFAVVYWRTRSIAVTGILHVLVDAPLVLLGRS
jgi:membrane protease YdiL (CAAX protease family)